MESLFSRLGELLGGKGRRSACTRPRKPMMMRAQVDDLGGEVTLGDVPLVKSLILSFAHVKAVASWRDRAFYIMVISPQQPLRLPLDDGASGPFSTLVVGWVPDSFVVVVVVVVAVASSARVSSRRLACSHRC